MNFLSILDQLKLSHPVSIFWVYLGGIIKAFLVILTFGITSNLNMLILPIALLMKSEKRYQKATGRTANLSCSAPQSIMKCLISIDWTLSILN